MLSAEKKARERVWKRNDIKPLILPKTSMRSQWWASIEARHFRSSCLILICSFGFENVRILSKLTSYPDTWRKRVWWNLAEITKLLSIKLLNFRFSWKLANFFVVIVLNFGNELFYVCKSECLNFNLISIQITKMEENLVEHFQKTGEFRRFYFAMGVLSFFV